MKAEFQARWVTKDRVHSLKKSGSLTKGILLDSFNGFILVEPVGSNLGDGEILSPETADYELQSVWCLDSKRKLSEARKLLNLTNDNAKEMVGA